MSFRPSDRLPLAFLPQPGGYSLTCTLVEIQADELVIQFHGPALWGWDTGSIVAITLDPETSNPERCVMASVTRVGPEPGELRLAVRDAQGFWAAARAADNYNRRRCFRVSTLDALPVDRARPGGSLQIEVHHRQGRVHAEMLDLSVSGCGLRIPRQRWAEAPEEGSRVMIQVSGGDLQQPLRVPAEVLRQAEKKHHLLLGLRFLQGDNRSWKQVEQQIAHYLALHQQRLLGTRAA